jgi:hypothetical protein
MMVLTVPVYAERVQDLYQYTTLVSSASKNSQEYRQALSDGLAEVIVRASGDVRSLQNPGILDALGRPARLLSQEYFENSKQTIEIDGRQVAARCLVLEYSGERIQNLLRDLQLPIWPDNRRNILVWMVVDDAQGQRVVSESNLVDAITAVKENGKRRGLPVLVPLMDIDDKIALSANQLWAMAQDDIRKASERYSPDTILVGRLSQTSRGDWRSDWQLFAGDDIEIFDSQGLAITDAIAGGIDQVANYFFQRYAINPQLSAAQDVLLFQVADIQDFSQYTKVLNYLDQLTVVRKVDLVAVRDDNLLLYLRTDGDVKLLQDTLSLDGKLLPRNQSNGVSPLGSVDNPLLYAWRP